MLPRQLHLLAFNSLAPAEPTTSTSGPVLFVPETVSCLDPHTPSLTDRRCPDHLFLEPVVTSARTTGLLLLTPRGGHLPLINGQIALAPTVVLHERDEFSPAGSFWSFAVTFFHQPYVGPPQPDRIGLPCPICRNPVAADTRVELCAHCGIALHHEQGDPTAVLQCVTGVTDCPACRQPWSREAGYSYVPTL